VAAIGNVIPARSKSVSQWILPSDGQHSNRSAPITAPALDSLDTRNSGNALPRTPSLNGSSALPAFSRLRPTHKREASPLRPLKNNYHRPKAPAIGDDTKAWVVHVAFSKPKDLGYAAENLVPAGVWAAIFGSMLWKRVIPRCQKPPGHRASHSG
jgi:hypothetical protein